MYSEFAYSRTMQVILAVMTFIFTFVFIYLIAILILHIFGEKADRKQKAVFAFLVGGVLNTIWAYAIYFIGGMRSFTPTVYALVVNPNPIFALLYYIIGVKVLNIPPMRSIKLMGHVYLYYAIVQIFNRILNTLFFVQATDRYNYMLDAACQFTLFCVIWMIYLATKYLIKRYNYTIDLNLFIDFKKEMALYILKATFIYLMIVGIPLFISNQIVANLIIFSIFILIFLLTNLWELYESVKNEVGYKDEYIRVLSRDNADSHEEDSYLHKSMRENPSLISILIGKCDYAKKMNVKLSMKLLSRTDNFYINNIDICRIVDCLLENAIEAAAASERKSVSFTVGSRSSGEKLIMINNSTATPAETNKIIFRGKTTMYERQGKGISTVRKIVSKYDNCTFKTTYHHYDVSTYLEMKMQPKDTPRF